MYWIFTLRLTGDFIISKKLRQPHSNSKKKRQVHLSISNFKMFFEFSENIIYPPEGKLSARFIKKNIP